MFSYLLEHYPGDVITIDPITSIVDETTKAVNLSAVERHIRTNVYPKTLKGKLRVAGPEENGEKGKSYVNFQRGTGNASQSERNAIYDLIGKNTSICEVHLAPGKYDSTGFPNSCYSGFKESVAQLINQFVDLHVLCTETEEAKEGSDTSDTQLPCLNRMYIALSLERGRVQSLESLRM